MGDYNYFRSLIILELLNHINMKEDIKNDIRLKEFYEHLKERNWTLETLKQFVEGAWEASEVIQEMSDFADEIFELDEATQDQIEEKAIEYQKLLNKLQDVL